MTQQQLARAEFRLMNPVPGSPIAAAKEFGVDLTLVLQQLRLSPAERAQRMLEICQEAEKVRGAVRRGSK